ncbi:MAG: hypothetical protein WC956_03410 [bacterium]
MTKGNVFSDGMLRPGKLNDFSDSDLAGQIEEFVGRHGNSPLARYMVAVQRFSYKILKNESVSAEQLQNVKDRFSELASSAPDLASVLAGQMITMLKNIFDTTRKEQGAAASTEPFSRESPVAVAFGLWFLEQGLLLDPDQLFLWGSVVKFVPDICSDLDIIAIVRNVVKRHPGHPLARYMLAKFLGGAIIEEQLPENAYKEGLSQLEALIGMPEGNDAAAYAVFTYYHYFWGDAEKALEAARHTFKIAPVDSPSEFVVIAAVAIRNDDADLLNKAWSRLRVSSPKAWANLLSKELGRSAIVLYTDAHYAAAPQSALEQRLRLMHGFLEKMEQEGAERKLIEQIRIVHAMSFMLTGWAGPEVAQNFLNGIADPAADHVQEFMLNALHHQHPRYIRGLDISSMDHEGLSNRIKQIEQLLTPEHRAVMAPIYRLLAVRALVAGKGSLARNAYKDMARLKGTSALQDLQYDIIWDPLWKQSRENDLNSFLMHRLDAFKLLYDERQQMEPERRIEMQIKCVRLEGEFALVQDTKHAEEARALAYRFVEDPRPREK